ncbi:MAG: ABC transporter permease [Clostridia bacterium]|nr:ABC transporter permease [Lachnospiraceae bacterium]NCB99386.1 ABC transporter permease [Clostridia bacterium]
MVLMRERIHTFIKYKDLLRELVVRDLKLKYRRSFLGYLWSILNPLLIMIVMTVVFSHMFRAGIENFPVYLLAGQAVFDFIRNSTTMAMYSVLDNAALIKKIYVPKYIFTLSRITSTMVDFVFSLGALLLVMIVTRTPFSPHMLATPVLVIQVYIFACGMGFFLSAANVFFRDMQYIYGAFMVAWQYLTPLFYPLEMLPGWLQSIVTLVNPAYYYVEHFRDLVLYGHFPSAQVFWGGWIFAFIMLAFGLFVFKKAQDKFILYF